MMKKSAWIVIVLLIVAAIAAALLLNRAPAVPEGPEMNEDTTAQVNEALEGVNVEDVQGEFEEIDEAIEGL